MTFELKDELAENFEEALKQSGEDKTKVIERMFKTYSYDVFSREKESFRGLESFMKMPKSN